MKYLVVTKGQMMTGHAKGFEVSGIGLVLKNCGFRVTFIKLDPYLNIDAGTMSPVEHGEVFVLDDGGKVDSVLGDYQKFLDIKLTQDHYITSGKIYQYVIEKERSGDYLGKTVEVVPDIVDAVQEWIERAAKINVDGMEGPADICVIELGGTIGGFESMSFIEALSQFSRRVGPGNFCMVHFSVVPVLNEFCEQKIKLTLHSILDLRRRGLTSHILACRSSKALENNEEEKLSKFFHIPETHIVTFYDACSIWNITSMLRDQKVHEAILKELNLMGSI